ncbi:hypothetical protein AB7645_05500 [Bradyrhizobium sp. 956_D2_N1_5]|uniref:hypothetical protein n=1 Tax=unclassified Bradyrhizobium TaxID=2631580 RepID=UPI003F285944
MTDIKHVYQRGIAQMHAAYKEAELDYQHAALADDIDGMARAGVQMAGLEATFEKFNSIANRTANPQQRTPTNQHGLTAAESEAARLSGVTDEEYGRNKARLWDMRNRGLYPMPGQG